MPEKNLSLGVILPNTKIFGGVKRFFEIGNILVSRGHRFTVLTPDGEFPTWFDFRGSVVSLENLDDYIFDVLFITEVRFLTLLLKAHAATRIFYAVIERRYVKSILQYSDIYILANSTSLYNYLGGDRNPRVFKALGGIDTEKFAYKRKQTKQANDPFIVLVYGRFYKRKKGTMLVVRACEKLYKAGYNIKLHLFDTPTDAAGEAHLKKFTCSLPFEFFIGYPVRDLPALYYQADVFVSAERNAGWSNTSAEAVACGTPVIVTKSGTRDFIVNEETGLVVWRHPWFIRRAIKRLIHDSALCDELSENARTKIEEFSWKSLSLKIEEFIDKRL